MSWGGGTDVMTELIDALFEARVLSDQRKLIYRQMLKALADLDWDGELECFGIDVIFDETVEEMHPEWFDED
jgi:hypothetical protein